MVLSVMVAVLSRPDQVTTEAVWRLSMLRLWMTSTPGTVTSSSLSPVMVSTAQPRVPSTTKRLSSSLRPRMAPPFLSETNITTLRMA